MQLSEQVRRAVRKSRLSRYAIGKAAGIDKAVLSRFMAGRRISMPTLDALAEVLRLKVVVDSGRRTRKAGEPCESSSRRTRTRTA